MLRIDRMDIDAWGASLLPRERFCQGQGQGHCTKVDFFKCDPVVY